VSFTLLVKITGIEPLYLDLIVPGKVFTGSLEANSGQYYKLDVMEAQSTAMILFGSEHPSIIAELSVLSGNKEFGAETFDSVKFGIRIDDIKKFKKRHCKLEGCIIQVFVTNESQR
jgi:hypothetical protein